MKNTYYKRILIALYILFFASVSLAYAQTAKLSEYQPLAPIDVNGLDKPQTLSTFIPRVFEFSIGIAALLAFAVITFGGILYATSDAISGKSQGKEYVTNALWGLLLVIGAYVILYTINPNFVSFYLGITPLTAPTVTGGGVPSGGAGGNVGGNIAGVQMTADQLAADQAVRTALGPSFTAAGACTQGGTQNCVDLNGLAPESITGLKALQQTCNCTVNITGGTEAGHTAGSDHNAGTGVDIRADSTLTSTIQAGKPLIACSKYDFKGGVYLWEPSGVNCGGTVSSTGDHWHVTY